MAIKQRPLTFRPLHLDVICDVCNKGRGHGNHQKCSKIRQKRNAWKWTRVTTNENTLPVPPLPGAQEAEQTPA